MSKNKIIIWGDTEENGNRRASIYILVGYMRDTLRAFRDLADEIRETFPVATDDEITCGKIAESDWCKRFAVVHVVLNIPYREYEGWEVWRRIDFYW